MWRRVTNTGLSRGVQVGPGASLVRCASQSAVQGSSFVKHGLRRALKAKDLESLSRLVAQACQSKTSQIDTDMGQDILKLCLDSENVDKALEMLCSLDQFKVLRIGDVRQVCTLAMQLNRVDVLEKISRSKQKRWRAAGTSSLLEHYAQTASFDKFDEMLVFASEHALKLNTSEINAIISVLEKQDKTLMPAAIIERFQKFLKGVPLSPFPSTEKLDDNEPNEESQHESFTKKAIPMEQIPQLRRTVEPLAISKSLPIEALSSIESGSESLETKAQAQSFQDAVVSGMDCIEVPAREPPVELLTERTKASSQGIRMETRSSQEISPVSSYGQECHDKLERNELELPATEPNLGSFEEIGVGVESFAGEDVLPLHDSDYNVEKEQVEFLFDYPETQSQNPAEFSPEPVEIEEICEPTMTEMERSGSSRDHSEPGISVSHKGMERNRRFGNNLRLQAGAAYLEMKWKNLCSEEAKSADEAALDQSSDYAENATDSKEKKDQTSSKEIFSPVHEPVVFLGFQTRGESIDWNYRFSVELEALKTRGYKDEKENVLWLKFFHGDIDRVAQHLASSKMSKKDSSFP